MLSAVVHSFNVVLVMFPVFYGISCPLFQAASALHELYKKFPGLYNSSIVSSFEPKVIYKVTKHLTEYDFLNEERERQVGTRSVFWSTDASD